MSISDVSSEWLASALAAPAELLATAEMGRADAFAVAGGTPGRRLMRRAGEAVAEAAASLAPVGGRVVALCGPGANGGDGFVAARLLAGRGFDVAVYLLGDRERLTGDAASAAAAWAGPAAPLDALDLAGADVAIDAIFGAGLSRDVDGEALRAVEALVAFRSGGGRIVAVDTPSGVDGNTGAVRGAAAPADATVTFFRKKPGHVLAPGRALCGRVVLADIGVPDEALAAIGPRTFTCAPALWRAVWRAPAADGHKYDRGHCLVVSGGPTRTGAARLAARAALRAGAGLVTLGAPAEALPIAAAQLTAVMLARCEGAADLAGLLSDSRLNAVVLGPAGGVGAAMRARVEAALISPAAVALDADALTSFSGEAAALAGLIVGRTAPVVLTPHEGEFVRLFGARAGSKLDRARAAAAETGAVVVLKGADTVVAAPDGRAAINDLDAPWLATAGSGDALAGFVGGLLAQGVPGFEAAAAAVWLHAAVGRALGPGMIAEDIADGAPTILRRLFAAAQA
ncbi:MAG: NAD(P)H-hydrate dehydratase [Rhizobiales bacterium]|nr:NAD(P)H-hydrate dehydratase [Hyphomicrobiales bacterium]